MMTLEEAILYCEEVAEINQSIADNIDHNNWMDIAKCEKCADEHRQVAERLRELKQYREQPEIVMCKDCKHWIPYDWMFSEVWQSRNIADYPEYEMGCKWCDMSMKANDFCSRADRREVTT